MEQREVDFRKKLAELGLHRVKALIQTNYWNMEWAILAAIQWVSEQEESAARSTHRWAVVAAIAGIVSVLVTIGVAIAAM